MDVKRKASTPGEHRSASGAGSGNAPALPAWKAFVVQFSRETRGPPGVFGGRVEHLSTGRRARFDSGEQLLTTLRRLLATIDDPEQKEGSMTWEKNGQ